MSFFHFYSEFTEKKTFSLNENIIFYNYRTLWAVNCQNYFCNFTHLSCHKWSGHIRIDVACTWPMSYDEFDVPVLKPLWVITLLLLEQVKGSEGHPPIFSSRLDCFSHICSGQSLTAQRQVPPYLTSLLFSLLCSTFIKQLFLNVLWINLTWNQPVCWGWPVCEDTNHTARVP